MRKRSSNASEKKEHSRKRGKIVTVARQRALNIVKSHVKMSKIIEGLYLCSVKAVTEENIKQNDIRASVDLSKMRVIERRIKNSGDIDKLVVDINDEPRQAATLQRQRRDLAARSVKTLSWRPHRFRAKRSWCCSRRLRWPC